MMPLFLFLLFSVMVLEYGYVWLWGLVQPPKTNFFEVNVGWRSRHYWEFPAIIECSGSKLIQLPFFSFCMFPLVGRYGGVLG